MSSISIDKDNNTTIITIEIDDTENIVHQGYWECNCSDNHTHSVLKHNCDKCGKGRFVAKPSQLSHIIGYLYSTKEYR